MDNDIDNRMKGFSGLSNLVSEIVEVDDPSHDPTSGMKPPPIPTTSTKQAIPHEAPQKPAVVTVSSNQGRQSSGWKWIIGVIAAVGLIVWVVNTSEPSTKKPGSYTATAPSQGYTHPPSRPAPAVPSPSAIPSSGAQYEQPPVGTNNVLSMPQICWCLRQDIRIEAMRDIADTEAGVLEFNRIVDDYNGRCGSYRYREGVLEPAKRAVEAIRDDIVKEAIQEARQFSHAPQASRVAPSKSGSFTYVPDTTPTTPVSRPYIVTFHSGLVQSADQVVDNDPYYDIVVADRTYSIRKELIKDVSGPSKSQSHAPVAPRPSAQDTREVQELLTALGYKPGIIDGDYGRFTSDAIKAFQKDAGLPQDGAIDQDLVDLLKKTKAALKPTIMAPPSAPPTPPDRVSIPTAPPAPPSNSTYFTRGSSQDEVLGIQGRPDDINDYAALGYREWKYGYSSVKISSRDQRVLSWANQGNLKVQLLPGQNVTAYDYFTRGSHQDDVLRIQGTPNDINDYSALGYEEWKYGYSSVKISGRDRRVLSWANQGNLKVLLQPGPNITTASSFTRGSHQDDVLRIQGTPDDINDYSALGYEEWKYGYSSIKISGGDRRVLSWANQGNLKVQLLPGSNTTAAPFFTHGSHQDDVLRLQGTPDDINDYAALGYEEWKYGYSSIKISTHDHRVLSWESSGAKLRAR